MTVTRAKLKEVVSAWEKFNQARIDAEGVEGSVNVMEDFDQIHKEAPYETEWLAFVALLPVISLAEIAAIYTFGKDDSLLPDNFESLVRDELAYSFQEFSDMTMSLGFGDNLRNGMLRLQL